MTRRRDEVDRIFESSARQNGSDSDTAAQRVPRERFELNDAKGKTADAVAKSRTTLTDRRAPRTVRGKLMLVVLSTTAIALLVAGIALVFYDLRENRQSWATEIATEGNILALSTAPALAFDDRDSAEQSLGALRARPSVQAAALYTPDRRLYASYSQPGAPPTPPSVPTAGSGLRISGERVELIQPIIRNGENLGTIYLRARYDVVGRVKAYIGILAVVMCISLAVALLLSRRLQSVITAPMESMANVARHVVDRRDYSQRAKKTTSDEIGVVVDAFNNMLDEVQLRANALEKANAALREEVQVRLAAEAALAHANLRLQNMMGAAEIGSWVWDLRTDELAVDRNFAVLYGRADENELQCHPSVYRSQVHPSDLSAVAAAEQMAKRTGVLKSVEFRIVQPDGSMRWVTNRGKAQLNEAGKPVLVSGLLIDITARKLAEQALQDSERLYRAIGESMEYGVWVCDAEGHNTYASDSFLQLTGLTLEQFCDPDWIQVLHPDDREPIRAAWRECVRTGSRWYSEHRIRGIDGEYHPILAQGVAIRDDAGRIDRWAGIHLDIGRLKRTEQALLEADRRKDEFLATLAHELRNPLAPIRNSVFILRSPNADLGQRQAARDVIDRQVRHMALLLDDLLDVSRITRGQLDLKKDYVDLRSIVEMALETARPLIDAKRHEMTVHLPATAVKLQADPLRLSQVISNLLTNAAKYTDANGRIALTASLEAEELVVSVKDSGIGLSAATIPGLFTMFSQVDSAIDRAEGGLGIGLALVKGLVALHGGRVSAASEGLGRGSEFQVRLPRGIVEPETAPKDEPAQQSDVSKVEGRSKILLADDNRDAAKTLAAVLEMCGYDVVTAFSGVEALAVGARVRPHAVLLDIGMPGMSGYEVARRIRLEAWGQHTVLIAVTGWGQDDDKRKARAAGFDNHLTKPVDPNDIERLLGAYLTASFKISTLQSGCNETSVSPASPVDPRIKTRLI